MPKLKWSKEEKKLVVLELLKGGKSLGQISKERGISEALTLLEVFWLVK